MTSRKPVRLGCWFANPVASLAVFAVVAVSCTSEPVAEIDAATYREQLGSVCTEALGARQALTQPADSADVTGFATEVAGVLSDESDQARKLVAPGELDADHRAFVQNTADQAAAWKALAATPPDDSAAFGALQTEILQLTLGRDELATDMGLEPCRTASP